jgi:RNA polymerase sigma-32 factor
MRRPQILTTESQSNLHPARRLRGEPVTPEELPSEFDISRERVRQIEVRAFEKVQDAVRQAALDQAKALRVVEPS